MRTTRTSLVFLLIPGLLFSSVRPVCRSAYGQRVDRHDAGAMILAGAQHAYNEHKYEFAANRFREFLAQHRDHRSLPDGYYGLGMSLLRIPEKDYAGAVQAFRNVVGRANFRERASALYWTAVGLKGVAEQELAAVETDPPNAGRHRDQSRRQLEESARHFGEAAKAYLVEVKEPVPAELPVQARWASRARADQCHILLELGKFGEVHQVAAATLQDPKMAEGPYRDATLYHLGYAAFMLKNYLEAGRALSRLHPFQQSFGLHARYLLARTHHLANERHEAEAQYKAVVVEYRERRLNAQDALKHIGSLTHWELESFASLSRGPTPEHVARALFYQSLLACEQERYAEAHEGFAAFVQQYPDSPLLSEAKLRQGFCLMEQKQFVDASRLLDTLKEDTAVADRALWWLGRCRIQGTAPAAGEAYARAVTNGLGLLVRAADLAAKRSVQDAGAATRQVDILLEIADALMRAGRHPEAEKKYEQVLREKKAKDRAEEAMQRRATALHLAGAYEKSDRVCAEFAQKFPDSILTPAVLFRGAENAYFLALKKTTGGDEKSRADSDRLFSDAIKRYRRVSADYPDFTYANPARRSMADAYYRLGRYDDAATALGAIPEDAWSGDLKSVPYLLAECLLRTAPSAAGDAVSASQLVARLERIAKLLERFTAAGPTDPQAADALFKLGRCYQRLAAVMSANPAERTQMWQKARATYDRLLQPGATGESVAAAVFERANCLALLGDHNTAMHELGRFRGDPLKNTAVAAPAIVRLSIMWRERNKPHDAERMLQQFRAQREPALLKDPKSRDLAFELQYEHALAFKAVAKPDAALEIFARVIKEAPDTAAGINSVWRAAQCRREGLAKQLPWALKTITRHGVSPQDDARARQVIEKQPLALRETLESLQSLADRLGGEPGSLPHQWLLYEAAWCARTVGEIESTLARWKLEQSALAEARKRNKQPALRLPIIPLSAASPRTMELLARQCYLRLIAAAPAAPLTAHARLELAEMLAARGNSDEAAIVLREGAEQMSTHGLADQLRIRLAALALDRNSVDAALIHLHAVTNSPDRSVAISAAYLLGEAFAQQEDWKKVIPQLLPFRDNGHLQRIARVSDRALIRLAEAYSREEQWEQSRRTFEAAVQRFRSGPWLDEAQYGIGCAWQKVNDFDKAVQAYLRVAQASVSEWAAKSQLQIGRCRAAQKRHEDAVNALLAVVYTFDYPEWSVVALQEAADACVAQDQSPRAARLWRKLVDEHPDSAQAAAARKHLAGIDEKEVQ